MKILQKYLFREWLWTFLAATVVLLIVMIGVSLGELLNDIAGGRVPSGLLWVLIGLKMPQVMTTILPLAVFVAVIWGLGRLYRDQEMAVMRASGFRWQMMLRPLFNLLLPVSVVLLLIGLYVAPLSSSLAQEKLENAFRNAAEWGLQTGQFHVLQDGDLVLYVADVERDPMRRRERLLGANHLVLGLGQNPLEVDSQRHLAGAGFVAVETDLPCRLGAQTSVNGMTGGASGEVVALEERSMRSGAQPGSGFLVAAAADLVDAVSGRNRCSVAVVAQSTARPGTGGAAMHSGRVGRDDVLRGGDDRLGSGVTGATGSRQVARRHRAGRIGGRLDLVVFVAAGAHRCPLVAFAVRSSMRRR